MKHLKLPIILAATAFLGSNPALAIVSGTPVSRVETTPSPTPSSTASNLPTPTPKPANVSASEQATRLATLKTKGSNEISRRIDSLNSALSAIDSGAKLSDANKATLVSQVQTEITGLTTLDAKLTSDTTLASARVDVQSIFNDFRVYALMLPKARLVTAADAFTATGDQFNVLANALQTRITNAKDKGTDVTAAQTALTGLETKLGDARTQYVGLADKVIALVPSDYNSNHAVLSADRDALVAARADFKAARAAVDVVRTDLGDTITPTATPKA